jgi:hypothetical protein
VHARRRDDHGVVVGPPGVSARVTCTDPVINS